MQVKALVNNQIVRELFIFAGLLAAALFVSQLIPHLALADGFITPDDNPDIIKGATNGESDFKSLALVILNYFLGFLGFVSVLMVIYGGILYVTSAGNDDNVGKAKKILLYAATGIVLILISLLGQHPLGATWRRFY
jgi:hypothetical protein